MLKQNESVSLLQILLPDLLAADYAFPSPPSKQQPQEMVVSSQYEHCLCLLIDHCFSSGQGDLCHLHTNVC
jgi:hypothetical protein